MAHAPVLLREALAALAPSAEQTYVDATFGGGGYAGALLAAAPCRVVAIDQDPDAIARGADLHRRYPDRLRLEAGRFGDIARIVAAPVDGIVFDLGVSSFQLDEAARGFSFRSDGPLDMRMSREGPSAADAVNRLSEQALGEAFAALGEDSAARRIARAVAAERARAPITRTGALADLIERAVGGRKGARLHPATKCFQALRMLVNDELGELSRALAGAEQILKPGGRLAVVAFHSLEDRLVKHFLMARSGAREGGSRHMPQAQSGPAPSFAIAARRAIVPTAEEIAANPRARSAKLRAAVRTAAPDWGPFAFAAPAPAARREWEAI